MAIQRRKLQRIGRSSYGITLPKKWVEEAGVEVGEQLELFVDPACISIYPGKKKLERTIKIIVDKHSEEDLKRLVIAYYLAGYNEMEFETKEEMFFPVSKEKAIKEIRTRLPAIDFIASESVTSIQLKASEFPLKIQQNLAKIREQIKKMYETVFKMFEFKETKKIVQAVDRLELGVDSHSYVAKRLILLIASDKTVANQQALDSSIAVIYDTLVTSLESSGDLLQSICHKIDSLYDLEEDNKGIYSNLKKISGIIKRIYDSYVNLFAAFEKRDLGLINRSADVIQYTLKPEIDSLTDVLLKSLPPLQLSLLWAISSELKWLHRCVWTASEAIIDIIVMEQK